MTPKVLARDGIIVPLQAPAGDFVLPLVLYLHNRPSRTSSVSLTQPSTRSSNLFWELYHVRSSLVASKAQHRDMLDFVVRNHIKPVVQVYKNEGPATIEQIFDNLEKGKVRYRAVLAF